jgi:transposase-like protein
LAEPKMLPSNKAIAIRLNVKELNLRNVSKLLKKLGCKVSHESIRKLFLKVGEIISNIKKVKK